MRSTAEVALGRRSRPEQERLVGVRHMQRGPVTLRVDADCTDSELAQRAEDADRDLPSVGDQNLVEHERAVFSTP